MILFVVRLKHRRKRGSAVHYKTLLMLILEASECRKTKNIRSMFLSNQSKSFNSIVLQLKEQNISHIGWISISAQFLVQFFKLCVSFLEQMLSWSNQLHVWKKPRALYIIQLDGGPGWVESGSGSSRISSKTPADAIYRNISTSWEIIVFIFSPRFRRDDSTLISVVWGYSQQPVSLQ